MYFKRLNTLQKTCDKTISAVPAWMILLHNEMRCAHIGLAISLDIVVVCFYSEMIEECFGGGAAECEREGARCTCVRLQACAGCWLLLCSCHSYWCSENNVCILFRGIASDCSFVWTQAAAFLLWKPINDFASKSIECAATDTSTLFLDILCVSLSDPLHFGVYRTTKVAHTQLLFTSRVRFSLVWLLDGATIIQPKINSALFAKLFVEY